MANYKFWVVSFIAEMSFTICQYSNIPYKEVAVMCLQYTKSNHNSSKLCFDK